MMAVIHTLSHWIIQLLKSIHLVPKIHVGVFSLHLAERVGNSFEVRPTLLQFSKVVVLPVHARVHRTLDGFELNNLLLDLLELVLVVNVVHGAAQVFDFVCNFLNLVRKIKMVFLFQLVVLELEILYNLVYPCFIMFVCNYVFLS